MVKVLGRFIVLAAALLSACESDSFSYRYRLAIEVEQDGQVRVESSVIDVKITPRDPAWGSMSVTKSDVRGEAVFTDMGGRALVAILMFGADGSPDTVAALAPMAFARMGTKVDNRAWHTVKGLAPLSDDLLPIFAALGDSSDPSSARVVRPEEFATVFGPGVRLSRAYVEMTSDPFLNGVEQRLPWLNNEDRVNKFARALLASSFHPNGSIGFRGLLKGGAWRERGASPWRSYVTLDSAFRLAVATPISMSFA